MSKKDKELVEVTPEAYKCQDTLTCPAVFKTGRGTYIVVGEAVGPRDWTSLKGRIGPTELAVEVPEGLLSLIAGGGPSVEEI